MKSFLLIFLLFFLLIPIQAQESQGITGIVLDEAGQPVIGASIAVEGTTNGIITDVEGKFILADVQKNGVLSVSYIGYETQKVAIKGRSYLKIKLKEDVGLLDEIVVIGYGTQKKVNLTGAVETISSKEIDDRPVKSVVDALQGNIPGLTVQSAQGTPGSFSTFKIRGSSSINSGGALVLIDGIPGNINDVNPQDIENISVLKDAASAAIYGARAAEGVLLITTKQASSEKMKIEYNGNFAYNTPTRIPETNDALLHANMQNLAMANAGVAPRYDDKALEAIKNPSIVSIPDETGNEWIYTANTNWMDLIFDHSTQQTHNVSLSRSSENFKYLLSFSYLDQNGVVAEYGPDNYDKMNIRLNTSINLIKKKLTLDSRLVYTNKLKRYHPKFADWTIAKVTMEQMGPTVPIYDQNGNYARLGLTANPIQMMREGGEGRWRSQILDALFTLKFTPTKNLTLKAIGGATLTNNHTREFRQAYGKYNPKGELVSMANGQKDPNSLSQQQTQQQYLTGQLLAEYNKKLGNHTLSILGGWSTEENKYHDVFAKRYDITGNNIPALGLGSPEGMETSADENEWALLSGFMRLNYDIKGRYLFETNFRADGSSRFSKSNRWGFFPSVSVGWRITEEPFMQKQKVLSNLKLRASWGQMGNQNGLGLYDHIQKYNVDGYYPFASEVSQWVFLGRLSSENRTWETVEMTNVALEAGFFDNRLTFTGELFYKRNKDMLVKIEIPSIIGVNVPTGNYGELEVKGWELSLGWKDKIKDFNYSTRFILSDQKDKLVDYATEYASLSAGGDKLVEGYSLGSIFGYITDGYFNSPEELEGAAVYNKKFTSVGDIKYRDISGPNGVPDGVISAPYDLQYLGTTTPRYTFGVNLTAGWKGVDFAALIEGVGKKNYYFDPSIMNPFGKKWNDVSYTMHNDYWREDNKNAAFPRPFFGNNFNYQTSTHWLQNAAYVRLKNIQVGYSLPKNITQKLGMSKIRFYFSGENLCEFSKLNKYFDPEVDDVRGLLYPIMRSYSLGLNVVL